MSWHLEKFNDSTPVMVSLPHSGLQLHPLRQELSTLPRDVFLRDVDLAVDEFWVPSCEKLGVSYIKAQAHRYVLDLNRSFHQIHSLVVQGAPVADPLSAKKCLFWYESTHGEALGPSGKAFHPLSTQVYETLVNDIWKPYYSSIETQLNKAHDKYGFAIFIDAHSMPSKGTAFHGDLQMRADFVPGNLDGKSCAPKLLETFQNVAEYQGFSIKANDPYKGGNLTQHFGRPHQAWHSLQIECNRKLYMDETKFLPHAQGQQRMLQLTHAFLLNLMKLRLG